MFIRSGNRTSLILSLPYPTHDLSYPTCTPTTDPYPTDQPDPTHPTHDLSYHAPSTPTYPIPTLALSLILTLTLTLP